MHTHTHTYIYIYVCITQAHLLTFAAKLGRLSANNLAFRFRDEKRTLKERESARARVGMLIHAVACGHGFT